MDDEEGHFPNLLPGDKKDWLSIDWLCDVNVSAYYFIVFVWCVGSIFCTVFYLYLCIVYQGSLFVIVFLGSVFAFLGTVFVLYFWTVNFNFLALYLYCILGQCICIVFVGSRPNQLAGRPVITLSSLPTTPQSSFPPPPGWKY